MDLVLLVGSFFVMLFLGIPIAFALCSSSLLYLIFFQTRVPLVVVAQQMLKGVDSFTLMAIPFFVIAGCLMQSGGISKRIVNFMAMSKITWDAMSESQQALIVEAAAIGRAAQHKLNEEATAAATQVLLDAGCTIEENPDKAAFQEIATGIWPLFTDKKNYRFDPPH